MSLWLLRKNTNIRMTLLVYTLILTALAYFFKPAETLDLYRLWKVHYKGVPSLNDWPLDFIIPYTI